MQPNLVYCCPTRGKPKLVDKYLPTTMAKAKLPDTLFILGIDEDEKDLYEKECKLLQDKNEHLKVVIQPRPDSLGEKYNLLAKSEPEAAAYIMGVDDRAIQSIAWDLHVNDLTALYEDGLGIVHFGRQWGEPTLPAFSLVTQELCVRLGYFMPPFFPYWWHDTWTMEMSEFLGRKLYLDIEVEYPKSVAEDHPTPRRDMQFWQLFFDYTRPLRIEQAKKILLASDTPPWRKYELMASWTSLIQTFEDRGRQLRDPMWVERFMNGLPSRRSEPDDERHQRLRKRAEDLMNENQGREIDINPPRMREAAE